MHAGFVRDWVQEEGTATAATAATPTEGSACAEA
jgi:hypothetical protein